MKILEIFGELYSLTSRVAIPTRIVYIEEYFRRIANDGI